MEACSLLLSQTTYTTNQEREDSGLSLSGKRPPLTSCQCLLNISQSCSDYVGQALEDTVTDAVVLLEEGHELSSADNHRISGLPADSRHYIEMRSHQS
jgi:hypothetical protein